MQGLWNCYSKYVNLLDSVEHITGSARYSAPGMNIISVRAEDLVEDLELEVMVMFPSISLLIWDNLVSVINAQIDWTSLLIYSYILL